MRAFTLEDHALKTIAIVSQKGGSGKTTTTTNLAVAAVEAGKSALVIDLDPQASATGWHSARVQQDAPAVLPTHHAALKQLLDQAEKQGVDFVFIDTAAKTEIDARAAIDAADVVLVPCCPSAHDLRAIMNSVQLCQLRNVKPHVVLTQVENNSPLTQETRETLTELGIDVLPTMVGRRRAFIHTATDGRGVIEFEKRGKAAEEIRALFAAIRKLAGKHASTQANKQRASA